MPDSSITNQEESSVTSPSKALSKLVYFGRSMPFPLTDEDFKRKQRDVRNPSKSSRSHVHRSLSQIW